MSARRLPVYILLDTSGSMRGEPIHSVNVGLRALLDALRADPYALESVHLSIITFDNEARVYLPLTPVDQVQLRDITILDAGATYTGAALELLIGQLDREVRKSTAEQQGDWRPLLFVMTDGSPSDTYAYQQILPRFKTIDFGLTIGCACGPKAKTDALQQITSQVVALETMDSATFSSFFKWVSASVVSGTTSAGISRAQQEASSLPPPPPEVQLVL